MIQEADLPLTFLGTLIEAALRKERQDRQDPPHAAEGDSSPVGLVGHSHLAACEDSPSSNGAHCYNSSMHRSFAAAGAVSD